MLMFLSCVNVFLTVFFFQAEDGIRDRDVTGVQTCALPISPTIPSVLTKRELEVLGLLAEGLAQREIATRLTIREKTVGSHIERILSKLGVRSRAQAVALAFREDLVGVSTGTAARSSHRPKNLARAAQTT